MSTLKIVNNKLFSLLSSQKVTVFALLLLSILSFWGTLYQVNNGLFAAQQLFFNSWVILVSGFLPFPGVKSVMVLLSINLIFAALYRIKYNIKKTGLILVHSGVAVLIIGMGFTHYFAKTYTMALREKESSSTASYTDGSHGIISKEIPVKLMLVDFVKKEYHKTDVAKSFESKLHVCGPGIDRNVVITMNKPFRYRNYSFYQSGYNTDDNEESSEFIVVENSGKLFPYIATLMIATGLIIHFVLKFIITFYSQRGMKNENAMANMEN